MTHPTPEEIAWAAGLFEGEGTFTLQRFKKDSVVVNIQLVARIHMTDRDIVERFGNIMGFGHFWDYPVYRSKLGKKPSYTWYTSKPEEWFKLWEMFWKYLGNRRRLQAENCIFEWMVVRLERGLSV